MASKHARIEQPVDPLERLTTLHRLQTGLTIVEVERADLVVMSSMTLPEPVVRVLCGGKVCNDR